MSTAAQAQDTAARVFLPTPQTVGIWSLNLPTGRPGQAAANGATIADLSGNGLHATVEGNEAGDLMNATSDRRYDGPGRPNLQLSRRVISRGSARVAINNDGGAFEMSATDSFSIELYVQREDLTPIANWGILAGTWHSRNLIDDRGDPSRDGAWYGYGLLRHENDGGFATGGWRWVMSPVVNGQPRVGAGSNPEPTLGPGFEIAPGRHLLVLSVDRTTQRAIAYVDGMEVSRMPRLGVDWTFTTPTDHPARDHARFMLFTGEDDVSGNRYRPAPAGVHIDAVRVQRRAMTAAQVLQTWQDIRAGVPTPRAAANHVYTLDDNVLDSRRRGWNGRLEGRPLFVDGQQGRALRLTGAEAVRFERSNFGGQFTLTLWVRPDRSTPDATIETLIANSGGGYQTPGFRLFLNSFAPGGRPDGRVTLETGNGRTGAAARTGPGAIVPGEWTHVAVVVNRSAGQAAIYVNGVSATADSAILSDFAADATWSIGQMGDMFPYSGDLDDIRIWNRILTVAEIADLVPAPPQPELTASIRTSRSQVVVGQCLTALVDADALDADEAISAYGWRTGGAGAYTPGQQSQELSFDAADPQATIGVEVTTDQARTATASAIVEVRAPEVLARIDVSSDGIQLDGPPLKIVVGSTLTFDAANSVSRPPPGALRCPLSVGATVEPSPIVEYAWDLNGDGQTDAEGVRQPAVRFTTLGTVTVRMTASSAAGGQGTATFDVEVVPLEAPTPDAGPAPDASSSTSANPDAGTQPRNSLDSAPPPQECACTSTNRTTASTAALAAAAIALLYIRRRRALNRRNRRPPQVHRCLLEGRSPRGTTGALTGERALSKAAPEGFTTESTESTEPM